jgi:hypothetical protein
MAIGKKGRSTQYIGLASQRSGENDERSFQRDCTVCRSPPHRKVLEFTYFLEDRMTRRELIASSSRFGFNKPT